MLPSINQNSFMIANRGLSLYKTTIIGVLQKHVRYINLDKLSNKRITRIESDIELEGTDEFKPRLINRNPRNLEQLAFEKKPSGFWMEKSPHRAWNRLVFEQKSQHLDAYLQHWSGRKLVKASTSEPTIARYFNNSNTTQAAIVLAKVISRRCLQSGYLYAGVSEEIERLGPKNKAFFAEVEANGFSLNEPPEITPRAIEDV